MNHKTQHANKKPRIYFIYGAPASGKLTVAKELSKLIDVKLFHNHLSFDFAASIYDAWSDDFTTYCEILRIDAVARSVNNKNDLIFTFCYDKKQDDGFIKEFIKAVEYFGGELVFIHLLTNEKTILSRVENSDRKQYKKIACAQELKRYINEGDLFEEIEHKNNFKIETSNKTPHQLALIIKNQSSYIK